MAPHDEFGLTRRGFFQGVIGTAVAATLASRRLAADTRPGEDRPRRVARRVER